MSVRRGLGKGSYVIVFGEGDQRWQMTDPACERTGEARHAVRYATPERLTMADRYLVSSIADEMAYLVYDCPTTKLACEKLSRMRAAVRALPEVDEAEKVVSDG